MTMRARLFFASALAGVAVVSAPAQAQQIGDGTVTIANLYVPTVDLTSSPATYTATSGTTFQVLGTGAFDSVTGLTGVMDGTLLFSSTVGATIDQTVTDFFRFADGEGGFFSFTPTSVTTRTFNVTPGVTSSISLFLLGDTINTVRNFDPTPTSLTLSFNSTGGSAFSSSATLSIPPAGAIPEPAAWALMIGGMGLVGGAMRLRKRTVRFGVN